MCNFVVLTSAAMKTTGKKYAIQGLKSALSQHLPFRGQRLEFLAQFVLALIATRTVNLTQIALAFCREATTDSNYRRIQRFFVGFRIPQKLVCTLVLSFLPQGPYWLTMDRTNWQWGKADINILTVAIVYKGAAFPILWMLLPKKGNSSTAERKMIIRSAIKLLGKKNIAGLLADREFVGEQWFAWLKKEKISFHIRIRENFLIAGGKKRYVRNLFRGLAEGEMRTFPKSMILCGNRLFLSGTRLKDEFMIVVSDVRGDDVIETYLKRWEIETLFGCLKTRGFRFEDTHMTDPEKIGKLMALLTIAFCWAHVIGEWQHELHPIPLKKHGRRAKSIFRLGLDFLRKTILDAGEWMDVFYQCLRLFCEKRPAHLASLCCL